MAISKQVVPQGGWKFSEPRTGITIMALTYDNLVTHLIHHRKSNGLPTGDPETDIEEQLSKTNPEIVV